MSGSAIDQAITLERKKTKDLLDSMTKMFESLHEDIKQLEIKVMILEATKGINEESAVKLIKKQILLDKAVTGRLTKEQVDNYDDVTPADFDENTGEMS